MGSESNVRLCSLLFYEFVICQGIDIIVTQNSHGTPPPTTFLLSLSPFALWIDSFRSFFLHQPILEHFTAGELWRP